MLRGRGKPTGSTLAELEALAGTGLTILFALFGAGIAGQQAFRLESRAHCGIHFK